MKRWGVYRGTGRELDWAIMCSQCKSFIIIFENGARGRYGCKKCDYAYTPKEAREIDFFCKMAHL